MRILLLAAAAGIAACATASTPAQRTAEAQARLDELLAGKTAGPATRCLPLYRKLDMKPIDDQTIVFAGRGTAYVNHTRGSCNIQGRDHYALVTRTFKSTLCSGDIAQVVDPINGIQVGSCAMGDFIPYRR